MNTGFRVLKRQRAVDLHVAQQFMPLPVANVSDCLFRMTAGGARLKPMHAGGRMAGPALTVKTRPGDNLMIHKALQIAVAGDVIVVDGGGDLTNSLIGEIMAADAALKKLGGLVIYGAIRDAGAIRAGSFPVFAAGVTHRGPYKDGPGEINVPISIEGMVIEPGDLMLGDDDGVLSVPFDDVSRVFSLAEDRQALENHIVREMNEGRTDRSWIDAALKRGNCYIES